MGAEEKLGELEASLTREGAERLRLLAVSRARAFKRSWIEMAEVMISVREGGAYKRWGYKDFYEYCNDELQLRSVTVDKLTGSYQAVKKHAPHVMARDGVGAPLPQLDAVDYFQKAMEKAEPDEEVILDLQQAVFDEAKPVAVLRRAFNPVLYPKPAEVEEQAKLRALRNALRRVESLLAEFESAPSPKLENIRPELAEARAEIDALLDSMRKADAA